MASNNFINECKNYANCNRLGELKIRDDLEISGLEGNTSQEGTPTPDNPINVNVVSGNNTIKVLGKNLFDYKTELIASTYGLTNVLNDDGSITTSGIVSGNYRTIAYEEIYDILEDGATYTISQENITNKLYLQINCYRRDGGSTTYISISNRKSISFQVDKATYNRYRIVIQTGTATTWGQESVTITNKYQIEKNSTYTNFEKYKEQDYDIDLRTSKNLFDKSSTPFISGKYLTSNGSQTSSNEFSIYKIAIQPNTTYTLTNSGASSAPSLCYYNKYGTYIDGFAYSSRANITFTTPSNARYILVSVVTSTTSSRYDLNIFQIEKGEEATTYEAYNTIELCKIGDYKDKIIKTTGINLLEFPYTESTKSSNGITFTVRNDGSVLVNGTATANANIKLMGNWQETSNFIPRGKYLYGGSNNVKLRALNNTNNNYTVLAVDTGNGAEIDTSVYEKCYIELTVFNGTVVNNEVIYPMLLYNLDNTKYEPYEQGWYIKKEIGKVVLNGGIGETWQENSTTRGAFQVTLTNIFYNKNYYLALSNYFLATNGNSIFLNNTDNSVTSFSNNRLYFRYNTYQNNLAGFKSWLSTHNTTVYYVLASPTYTKITNETLINQLEAIKNAKGQFGSTTLLVTSSNLPITVDNTITEGLTLNQEDYIQEFTIDSGCYVDGEIIGTVYSKKIETKLIDSKTIDLQNKEFISKVGVVYNNNTNEYEELGKFTVENPKEEQTDNASSFVAYDDLINHIDDRYVTELDYDDEGNSITLSNVYEELCRHLELTPVTTTFTNSNIPVNSNPFTNGEKNRDVLKSIEKVSCSYAKIDKWNNTIDLVWLSDTLDYTFTLDDYASLEGGKTIYGPINTLIIRNSEIEEENVSISDQESIEEYGEHQLVIAEDYFLYDAALREAAIQAIWNKVHNLTYIDCKLKTYTGKPFLDIGNKIRVYTDENNYFDTYVLKHEFKFNGAFESVIESPALTEQEIKTKQDITLQEKLRNTQIIVNKQEGTIQSVVSSTETLTTTATNALGLATTANDTVGTVNNDLQTYKNTVSSQFTQTANDYTLLFNQAITAANDAADTEEAHYQTQQQYIRFAGDTISLGKSDSPFTAELSSTELAFKEDNTKVAYISNKKMNITEAEITTSLTLGNFGFVPRSNGSLSFRKVK